MPAAWESSLHHREPASIDHQTIIRLNRDTLYSFAVFDLDAGPVTVTMPDAGNRFMSLQVINEDHYVPAVFYGPGSYTLSRENVGTRYAAAGIRTLVDPNDPKDLQQVHALQDAIKVSQNSPGTFEVPRWDPTSQNEIRRALLALAAHTDGFSHAFGTKDQVDPIKHLIGTAAGWGGNPDKDAVYVGAVPAKNDGSTVYTLHVKDVPIDAFWSVTVYNAAGYFEKNPYDAYSLNSITAKKNADGSVESSVWRLRRHDHELLAGHEGMELHGAALSPACRDPKRRLEVPGSATGRVKKPGDGGRLTPRPADYDSQSRESQLAWPSSH